jgi:tetratricopeptide (TPR) repeat protein
MLEKDSSREAEIRERHSAYYCAFLQQHTDGWHTQVQLETLAAVGNEVENARRALNWALIHGNWQQMNQAIDCWGWFLDWRNRELDGISFCEAIINQARSLDLERTTLPPDCLLAWAKALAWLIRFSSNYQTAASMKDEGLALLNRAELAGQDIRLYKAYLHLMQAVYLVVTNPDEARLLYNQILSEYQSLGDQFVISECLHGLARIDFDTGQFTSALEQYKALIPIYEDLGDRRRLSKGLAMLALIQLDLGKLGEAEQLQRQSLKLLQELDYRAEISWSYTNLARTLLLQGKLEEAKLIAGKGLRIVQDIGDAVMASHTSFLTYCGFQIYDGSYLQARQKIAVANSTIGKSNADIPHLKIHLNNNFEQRV